MAKVSKTEERSLLVKFDGDSTVSVTLLNLQGREFFEVMREKFKCEMIQTVNGRLPDESKFSLWCDEEGRMNPHFQTHHTTPFRYLEGNGQWIIQGPYVLTKRGGVSLKDSEAVISAYKASGFRVTT